MTTGEAIRELRARLNWTQQDLAYHAKLAIRTISNYESTPSRKREDILMRFAKIAADGAFTDLIDHLLPGKQFAQVRGLYQAAATLNATAVRLTQIRRDLDAVRNSIDMFTGAGKSQTLVAAIAALKRMDAELEKIQRTAA